ncbi:4Fe-4S binding protein [Deinococcus humi]|uniref:Ferredoxin n=1 Tax=Deinococcus humi TaxID=662880 RepID=A0A7W8K0P3_9DEIO|nr:4Fe-4S binding protein [Deinococcus humi]MBB5365079.1 ferredoxin [Deinococcus humi]GGO39522.1 polyferredoxin [Deinococcus humi]
MLQGLLSRLDDSGNLVPRYTPPRCLLERQAVGGCDICRDVCPHNAVLTGLVGSAIQIDADACTGCGICVQACPTGALEYGLQPTLQNVRDQKAEDGAAAGEGEASLTCPQSGAGGPQLPCLGRVTPAVLSAAGAWGTPLTLIHGECETCPVGAPNVPQRLEAVVAETGLLRAATGRPARVTVRAATPEDAERAVRVSRRGAFGALFRAGKAQLAQSIPESPLPFVDWSEPEERTPEEWKWRRLSLKPAPAPQAPVHWPAPVVDDTCIDCPVCHNVCPTDAIDREIGDDGSVSLLLNLSACTGCMACLRSCPPQAIHEQTEWLPAAFDGPILLREGASVM